MTTDNNNKAKNKPVILQILPELKSGGVERGTVEISKALVKNGYESIVASAGGNLVQQIVTNKATHIKLPLDTKNPLKIFLNIRRLVKVIKEHNVDIVHARSRAPAWSAYFAARKTGVHFITTFHGVYSTRGPFKKYYNSIMTRGEVVIAASDFIKQHIIDNYPIDKKKIKLISRGVDLSQFDIDKIPERRIIQMAEKLRIEHDRPVILLPGRLTSWKGHEYLLNTLEKIPNERFLCLFAGNDNKHKKYRKRLENKIKSLNLSGSVRIISNVMDMPALYCLSDVVVSASTRPESFGRVAVEAQAMGRLVVATNHGGSCETIVSDKTGWLVEPGNVDDMAKTIEKALKMTQRARKLMTNRAKKHIIKNFSLDAMTSETLEVYKKLLKKKKRVTENDGK